jgi:small conductance mechanosensitive channel
VVVVFWGLSKLVGKAFKKALEISPSNSAILNDFLINTSRRLTLIVGLLIALSMLEINIGPVVAIIGAAGFVVAFALQNTLSNFASGIMIMFYRPFDIGDLIEVSGVFGKVRSMTLVSTSVTTFDNKLMLVPNNQIWDNTITNATKSSERRVDMLFGIGYADDIGKARKVLDTILEEHPKVLATPEPMVRLHELGDSSVNFICRPWVKTADYWDVYWDVTRQVKERFDAEGISIPFPQQDVHFYQETARQEEKGHTSGLPLPDDDHCASLSSDFSDPVEETSEG